MKYSYGQRALMVVLWAIPAAMFALSVSDWPAATLAAVCAFRAGNFLGVDAER